MRKEVVIAIVLGFVLGLLITGGIWWTTKSSQTDVSDQSSDVSLTPSPSPTEFLSREIPLEISEPKSEIIVKTESLKLKGETSPQAVVVIIYPEGESIVEADDEGNFESTVTLKGGANEIRVIVYDEKGNKREETIALVYSTAEI